ncbi:RnfABCDGE type electron transport complex subunit B [Gynuella sunshinyii]|uniref:Ion-translocating oxidoreductase complex subunit B n=1 Tax=Gynuella sunshinyii YC6258 TaxID=1445510 RepID=A0A0C5VL17_9GAMM|nr:RnfABCDGE type electron transport complex subunit B [Gynuella sunshinyii]AJQ94073.1 putative NADH:ubiquinone oxidoreductase, subunit RnfB [Gynuella sunshinyii YC6258]
MLFISLVGVMTALGLIIGTILGYASRFFAVEENPLVQEIQALLPGSQCGQCGLPGCGQAAEAIASQQAPVTCCPPGGMQLATRLAELMGVDLDAEAVVAEVKVAMIVAENCSGCTRCYKVCPTDAIIGANKQIHQVFADACTGCRKCLDACPDDCIEMVSIKTNADNWQWPKPKAA